VTEPKRNSSRKRRQSARPAATINPRSTGNLRTNRLNVAGAVMPRRIELAAILISYRSVYNPVMSLPTLRHRRDKREIRLFLLGEMQGQNRVEAVQRGPQIVDLVLLNPIR
jgi:hypothetical protein